jgi:hypothetical protein
VPSFCYGMQASRKHCRRGTWASCTELSFDRFLSSLNTWKYALLCQRLLLSSRAAVLLLLLFAKCDMFGDHCPAR